MKRILDSDFRYRPSFETDLKKTFEKIRREQQAKDKQAKNVLQLDPLKKSRRQI